MTNNADYRSKGCQVTSEPIIHLHLITLLLVVDFVS